MGTPAYLRIVDDIRDQIRTGKLKPGDKLPSFSELCEQYEASNTVVRSAMLILKGEGLIDGQQGKGVFVRHRA
jgi:GntR family transcriptional regulator